jgi:hypothetical protein
MEVAYSGWVCAHHQRVVAAAAQRVQQLDQAVRRVAQADGGAGIQQPLQTGVQRARGTVQQLAGGDVGQCSGRGMAQRQQHLGAGGAAGFGGAAVQQHRQPSRASSRASSGVSTGSLRAPL